MNIGTCALADSKLRSKLEQIIKDYKIDSVIETGIDFGGSTYCFSSMVGRVLGIDNDPIKVDMVRSMVKEENLYNITIICGNSPDILKILNYQHKRTLFFLDAHWQSYWPLLDEIDSIPREYGIIVMHDVKVPGCPELGYDSYGGQDLDYDYVKLALTRWSHSHRIEYNSSDAEGTRRGVMFVYPE